MDASATGRPRREATWTLDAERTTFHGSPEGSVELVTPGDDARAALRSVFDAWRARQVGEIRRRDHSWDFELGLRDEFWGAKWSGFLAIHRNAAGEVDGYARYRPRSTGSSASHATPCRSTSSTD